jgi:hypothetical protein
MTISTMRAVQAVTAALEGIPSGDLDLNKTYIGNVIRQRTKPSRRRCRAIPVAPKNCAILRDPSEAAFFGLVRFWALIGQKCFT